MNYGGAMAWFSGYQNLEAITERVSLISQDRSEHLLLSVLATLVDHVKHNRNDEDHTGDEVLPVSIHA